MEDTIAFVNLILLWWRRFSEMPAVEVHDGIKIGNLKWNGARGLAVNEIPGIWG